MLHLLEILQNKGGGDFGHISANESRSFELDKSKQYFYMVSLGFSL